MNEDRRSKSEERFQDLVTVLISSVAILVAFTAFLQNYAANLSDTARRHAQEKTLDSATTQLNGAIQYSYQWQGAFQTWKEIDLQIVAAEQVGDTGAADRYRKLREKIAAL